MLEGSVWGPDTKDDFGYFGPLSAGTVCMQLLSTVARIVGALGIWVGGHELLTYALLC